MGGHYGSIHVRTEDASEVRAVLEQLAREHETKFLLAPPIGGWVTAFPSDHGQDLSIGEALAEKMKAPFLQCSVHDDDVFTYQYYKDGILADQYNSCPDYFGGEPTSKGGDVAAFRSVIPETNKQAALKKLLEAERFEFEMERFDQFAAILGLPNAVSAYEYLQDGERDGIKQWKKFVHIPDLTPERTAKRAAKARVKAEMKRLAAEGVLISDLVGPKSSHRLFHHSPLWTITPVSGEVWLMWSGVSITEIKPTPLMRVDPRTGGIEATNLNPSDHACSLAASSNGRWLAVGCASGDWRMQVWDLKSGQLALERPQSRASAGLCFSPDSQTLFSLSESTMVVAQGPELQSVNVIQLGVSGRGMMMHPKGEYLVLNHQGMLTIVHIPTQKELKTVWIDSQAGCDRALLEQLGSKALEHFMEVLGSQLSETELKEQRARMQRGLIAKQDVFTMTFSVDGELLICGTRAGVCVLDWQVLLETADMSPLKPRIFVEAEAETDEQGLATEHKLIYSVIHDAPRRRVLFAGLEGKVRFLDLETGFTGDLLVAPVRLPFWRLELTPDRTALVGTATRLRGDKPEPQRFQIWSYPKLCERAGIPF